MGAQSRTVSSTIAKVLCQKKNVMPYILQSQANREANENVASVEDKKHEYQSIQRVIPADPRSLQPAGMLKVFVQKHKNKTGLGYWTNHTHRKIIFLTYTRDLQAKSLPFVDNLTIKTADMAELGGLN